MVNEPFGEPIAEVILAKPPLVAVLSQIRFPAVASIANQDFIAPFQEKVRKDYPVLRKEQELGLIVGPNGVATQQGNGVIWRLQDKEQIWRLSLAPSFVSLETKSYITRKDFIDRFMKALDALAALIDPPILDRLGLRYVNRFQDSQLKRLREFIRPELLGFMGMQIGGAASVTTSILQTQFDVSGMGLLVRGVSLPPGMVIDPAIPAFSEPCWILDIDAFTQKQEDFKLPHIAELLDAFARTSYRLFRWSVTDQFISECGEPS
jgi:uncharacterized protein (TIGR04255 family)